MKILTLGLAGLLATGVTQQIRADVGTGAILGGIAGGIIGHQSRETAAGIAVGAVAGGLVGAALDRDGHRSRTTVVEYRSDRGYDPRCETPRRPWRHARYEEPCREVIYVPAPRSRTVVVVRSEPPPRVIIAPPPSTCLEDAHGYTSGEYLDLMKPAELRLLRQRAYDSDCADLAAYLTDQEKANLRARAARQVEIGS